MDPYHRIPYRPGKINRHRTQTIVVQHFDRSPSWRLAGLHNHWRENVAPSSHRVGIGRWDGATSTPVSPRCLTRLSIGLGRKKKTERAVGRLPWHGTVREPALDPVTRRRGTFDRELDF